MSQSGAYTTGSTPPVGSVLTLTGNDSVAVGPTLGNINVVGAGVVDVTGDAATSTLTISLSSSGGTDEFDTDTTAAFPSGGVINIKGGSNINTSGATNVVTINLDQTVVITGSLTAGTGLNTITGDVEIVAGNLDLPNTNSAASEGVININATPFIQNLGGNIIIGKGAGNFTLSIGSAINNTIVGQGAFPGVTIGANNSVFGENAMLSATNATNNSAFGIESLSGLITGTGNLALGAFSGENLLTDESNNILIGSLGQVSDENTIRIGAQGTGDLEQSSCYIAGIVNNTVSNAEFVTIDALTGQLGVGSIGQFADQFGTNEGIAIPIGNILDIVGGSNINTSGATNVVTINLNDTVSVSGSITAATGLTASSGGITAVGISDINNTGSASTNLGVGGTGPVFIGNSIGNTFMVGVPGNVVSNAQLVTIDSISGELGTTSASGVTWQVVTGATSLVEGNGYFVNGASTLQFTLPTSAAVGDTFEIGVLYTAVGGWQINQNANQYIIGNTATGLSGLITTVGTGGNVVTSSTVGNWQYARLICCIANIAFVLQYPTVNSIIFT